MTLQTDKVYICSFCPVFLSVLIGFLVTLNIMGYLTDVLLQFVCKSMLFPAFCIVALLWYNIMCGVYIYPIPIHGDGGLEALNRHL